MKYLKKYDFDTFVENKYNHLLVAMVVFVYTYWQGSCGLFCMRLSINLTRQLLGSKQ